MRERSRADGWNEASNRFGSTLCTHGLSTLAHSSCAARRSSGLAVAASSAVGEFGGRQRRAEAVGAEADAGAGVEDADGGRVVEQWRAEPGQLPVADVEGLARVEQVDPVDRQRPLGGHDPGADERGDDARLRCGLEQREQRRRCGRGQGG